MIYYVHIHGYPFNKTPFNEPYLIDIIDVPVGTFSLDVFEKYKRAFNTTYNHFSWTDNRSWTLQNDKRNQANRIS